MKVLILTVLFVLVSCGKQENAKLRNHYGLGSEAVDPAFATYFSAFTEKAKCLKRPLRYNALTIVFADLEKEGFIYNGLCTFDPSNGKALVRIDRDTWEDMHVLDREKLFNHELGHCALGLGHSDKSGDKEKIMNSIFMRNQYGVYADNYDHRIKELFGKTGDNTCEFNVEAWGDTTLSVKIIEHSSAGELFETLQAIH